MNSALFSVRQVSPVGILSEEQMAAELLKKSKVICFLWSEI
jgi:hypothetical protein